MMIVRFNKYEVVPTGYTGIKALKTQQEELSLEEFLNLNYLPVDIYNRYRTWYSKDYERPKTQTAPRIEVENARVIFYESRAALAPLIYDYLSYKNTIQFQSALQDLFPDYIPREKITKQDYLKEIKAALETEQINLNPIEYYVAANIKPIELVNDLKDGYFVIDSDLKKWSDICSCNAGNIVQYSLYAQRVPKGLDISNLCIDIMRDGGYVAQLIDQILTAENAKELEDKLEQVTWVSAGNPWLVYSSFSGIKGIKVTLKCNCLFTETYNSSIEEKYTTETLQQLCRELGLPITGTKETLTKRITNALKKKKVLEKPMIHLDILPPTNDRVIDMNRLDALAVNLKTVNNVLYDPDAEVSTPLESVLTKNHYLVSIPEF